MQIEGVRINNLHFPDDTTLFAESLNELQAMVYRMVEVKENFVMKVNIKKTEIQYMRSTHTQEFQYCNNESEHESYIQLCLIWRKSQFRRGNYIRHQQRDRDSKGCISGTRKGLVSKIHNDKNKQNRYMIKMSSLQL